MSAARRKSGGGSAGGRGRRGRVSASLAVVLALALGGWYLIQPADRQAEIRHVTGNVFVQGKQVGWVEAVADVFSLYTSEAWVHTSLPGDKAIVYGGEPRGAVLGHAVRRLDNRGYVVGYVDALAGPAWAAYHVRDLAELPEPGARPDRFVTDVRTMAKVGAEVFTNSGYDRGHLAPNYAIATRYGAEAQRETFLLSNIAPQRHALNIGPWRRLEQKIARSYPARFGEVWVMTGPIFPPAPARLGSERGPAIPEAFFLVLVDESAGRVRTLAVIVPQTATDSDDDSLSRWVTTVDEVERRTGLDFLSDLEDAAERRLEGISARALW